MRAKSVYLRKNEHFWIVSLANLYFQIIFLVMKLLEPHFIFRREWWFARLDSVQPGLTTKPLLQLGCLQDMGAPRPSQALDVVPALRLRAFSLSGIGAEHPRDWPGFEVPALRQTRASFIALFWNTEMSDLSFFLGCESSLKSHDSFKEKY